MHDLDLAESDTRGMPCQDFYRYANGRWLAANSTPAEYTRWGSCEELPQRNPAELHQILDQAAADNGTERDSIRCRSGRVAVRSPAVS